MLTAAIVIAESNTKTFSQDMRCKLHCIGKPHARPGCPRLSNNADRLRTFQQQFMQLFVEVHQPPYRHGPFMALDFHQKPVLIFSQLSPEALLARDYSRPDKSGSPQPARSVVSIQMQAHRNSGSSCFDHLRRLDFLVDMLQCQNFFHGDANFSLFLVSLPLRSSRTIYE